MLQLYFVLLFLRIIFVKKALDVAVSNAKLLLFISSTHPSVLNYIWSKQWSLICDNFHQYKAVTSCQRKRVLTLFQRFLKTAQTKGWFIWLFNRWRGNSARIWLLKANWRKCSQTCHISGLSQNFWWLGLVWQILSTLNIL